MVRLFILTVNENYNDCHQWKRMRTFLYIPKAKILWSVFIIQKSRHFAKSKTISITCLFTKCRTLYDTRFSWNFWISRLFTRSMTLCVTWRFYILKTLHFEKIKTIFHIFLYTKIRTFCVTRFFIEFMKLAEGRGNFYIQKIMHFPLSFYIQNAWHFTLHFYMLKTINFALRFNI